MGKSMHEQGVVIDQSMLRAGLKDGLAGKNSVVPEAKMKAAMTSFQKEMIEKAIQKQEADAAINQKASAAYLAKIAQEPGVQKIEPGLYYKVIQQGTGRVPQANDTVTVNYSGSLPNGTVFDSSYKRGQPATFQLSQVIPGWTDALQHMPEGSVWMIYISPKLGYGKYAPPNIGPDQALTFKVDLLKVVPGTQSSSSSSDNQVNMQHLIVH